MRQQTYVKVYEERTGHPGIDNRSRGLNRMVNRIAGGHLRVQTKGGRRRKKYLTTVEYRNYVHVLVSIVEAQQPHMLHVAPKTDRFVTEMADV